MGRGNPGESAGQNGLGQGKNRDKIPYTTDETGSYDDRSAESVPWNQDDGLNWWTNGFWGGIMWLLYRDTGEERYAEIARASEKKLEQCFSTFYGLHHDVGFMFLPTSAVRAARRAPPGRGDRAGRYTALGGRHRSGGLPPERGTGVGGFLRRLHLLAKYK